MLVVEPTGPLAVLRARRRAPLRELRRDGAQHGERLTNGPARSRPELHIARCDVCADRETA